MGAYLPSYTVDAASEGNQQHPAYPQREKVRGKVKRTHGVVRKCERKKKEERTLLPLYERALTIVAVVNSEGGGRGERMRKWQVLCTKPPITSRLSSYGIE